MPLSGEGRDAVVGPLKSQCAQFLVNLLCSLERLCVPADVNSDVNYRTEPVATGPLDARCAATRMRFVNNGIASTS